MTLQGVTEGGVGARPGLGPDFAPFRLVSAPTTKGASMTVRNLTGFAGACQEAVIAVLDAIATVGEERRGHLTDAKLAVDRALHDAHSGEE